MIAPDVKLLRKPGTALTPLGPIPHHVLGEIKTFGEQADRLEYPSITTGGYIVLGARATTPNLPGEEIDDNVRRDQGCECGEPAREETGSQSEPRPRQTQNASSASPHAVERQLEMLGFDVSGHMTFHPRTTVVTRSETLLYLQIPAGVFRDLPFQVLFVLELPLVARDRLTERPLGCVPDVRAWALWDCGSATAIPVASHRSNPDGSICACLPHEWIRGVHSLKDYVAFCIMWTAKALHEILFARYPGRQHYPARERRRRDRANEYCGCGGERRYADCCRAKDLVRSHLDLWRESYMARSEYFRQLAAQRRPIDPMSDLPSAA